MNQATAATPPRITGYDFARGISVLGMFLINFKMVMQSPLEMHHPLEIAAGTSQGFWAHLLTICEGRFAALFILLAGIGVSLMTQRARTENDPALLSRNRRTLFIRAALLFIAGLLYFPIWEADILHYYGIFILVGLLMLTCSGRHLFGLALFLVLFSPLLYRVFDWEAGWNWEAFTYEGFWTVAGFLRHTFFNGFQPIFPWLALFIFGMLIGRKNLADKAVRARYLWICLGLFLFCELLSLGLVGAIDNPEQALYFTTLSFPTAPLFIVSATCSSLVLILLSIMVTEKVSPRLTRPLVLTGQMALTHYVSHVMVGMVFLEAVGRLYNQSLAFSLLFATGFFALSMLFSMLWNRRFAKGPLETLMRKISG